MKELLPVIAAALLLIGCVAPQASVLMEPQRSPTPTPRSNPLMAEQIKIQQLPDLLDRVKNGRTEFNFAGITSNGIDCIYFMPDGKGAWDLDFEAMSEDQLPFLEQLRKYASDRGIKTEYKTYGNQPHFKSDKPAPVLHMETNLPSDKMAKFGEDVEREIFKNNGATTYDVVP